MKKIGIFTVTGLLLLGVLLIGMLRKGFVEKNTVAPRFTVVTSFYPLYFFAKEIVGTYGDVINITPAGAEPHDYELTAKDLTTIENADVVILNGELEPWKEQVTQNLLGKKPAVIVVADGYTTLTEKEEGVEHADPHIWLDPILATKIVERIVETIKKTDTTNATSYDINASNLNQKLIALDAEYMSGLRQCDRKSFVTSHAAFSYLANRYAIEQVAIAGLSPEEEPSPKQLAEVTAFAKKNKVGYIFFETLVSPKLSETIAQEVGAKTLVLDPIEGLSDDEIAAGESYLTRMRQNLANLQIALGCKP